MSSATCWRIRPMTDLRLSAIARRIGPSLLTFLLGTGALFAADVLVGRVLPAQEVARWATLKSVLLPLAAFALFGFDQMVVREPSKWKSIRLPALAMIGTLSVVGALVCSMLGFYDRPLLLIPAAILMAACNLYFGLFRADLRFFLAQISRDGWKVLFLAGIVAMALQAELTIETLLLLALFVSVALSVLVHAFTPSRPVRELFDEVQNFPSAIRIAFPFALVSAALAIASFGEVAVINFLGGGAIIADYFITALCFVSAMSMLNTFLSTFLGTMTRQHPERAVQWYDRATSTARRYWWAIPFAVLALPAATFVLGWIAHAILFPGRDLHLPWAMLMAITAGTRLSYTFISILVGALGDRGQITRTSFAYFGLAVLFPAIAYLFAAAGMEIGFAVALASVLHWLGRSVVGFSTGRKILSHYRDLQESGDAG